MEKQAQDFRDDCLKAFRATLLEDTIELSKRQKERRFDRLRSLKPTVLKFVNSVCRFTWPEFQTRYQRLLLTHGIHAGRSLSPALNDHNASLDDPRWFDWIRILTSNFPIIFLDTETVGTTETTRQDILDHPSPLIQKFFLSLPPFWNPTFHGRGNVARCTVLIGWPDYRLQIDFAQLGGMPSVVTDLLCNPNVIKVICGGYSTEIPALARVANLADPLFRNPPELRPEFLSLAGAGYRLPSSATLLIPQAPHAGFQDARDTHISHEPTNMSKSRRLLAFPSIIDATLRSACCGQPIGLNVDQRALATSHGEFASALGLLERLKGQRFGGYGVGDLLYFLTGYDNSAKSDYQGRKSAQWAPNGRRYLPSAGASCTFDSMVWGYIFGIHGSEFEMSPDEWRYVVSDAVAAREIFVAATLLLPQAVGQYTQGDKFPELAPITNFQQYLWQSFMEPFPPTTTHRLLAERDVGHDARCTHCQSTYCLSAQLAEDYNQFFCSPQEEIIESSESNAAIEQGVSLEASDNFSRLPEKLHITISTAVEHTARHQRAVSIIPLGHLRRLEATSFPLVSVKPPSELLSASTLAIGKIWRRTWRRVFRRFCRLATSNDDLKYLPLVAVAFMRQFEWLVNSGQLYAGWSSVRIRALHVFLQRQVLFIATHRNLPALVARQRVSSSKFGAPSDPGTSGQLPVTVGPALATLSSMRQIASFRDPIVEATPPLLSAPNFPMSQRYKTMLEISSFKS